MAVIRSRFFLPILLSLCFFSAHAQMSGTYTINKWASASSSNFVSFQKAAEALKKNGVSGQVTFNVVDTGGTYNEFANFGYVNGASSSNKIIFQNHSINKGKATLSDRTGNWSYFFRFDSAEYIEFKGIRFDASNRGVNAIHFYRNNAYITLDSCEFHGKNTNSYQNIAIEAYTTYTKNLDEQHHFYIQNCLITGYPNGMRFRGYQWASGYKADRDHVVSGCRFLNVNYPISTSIVEGMEISGNLIESTDRNQKLWQTGMSLQGLISGQVFNNQIRLVGKGAIWGISMNYCGGQSSKPTRVYNNYVEVDNSDSNTVCAAFEDYNTIRTQVVFNTFRFKSSIASNYAVRIRNEERQNENSFENNIISAEHNGLLFEFDTFTKNYLYVNHDHNNWFHVKTDSAFRYRGTYHDLAGFSKVANRDTNALNVWPYFDSSGYHTANLFLDGAGKYNSSIQRDIDGDPRGTKADVGVDEFRSYANAAGIDSLDHRVLCGGLNSPIAYLRNMGFDTLKSARIALSVRRGSGSWQLHKTIQWTGNLGPHEVESISLDTISVAYNDTYQLRVEIVQVNGKTDSLKAFGMNPWYSPAAKPGMGGTYTVGDSSSDFTDLKSALKELHGRGMCKSVELLLESKTFEGPFHLYEIPGSSLRDSIVIRSRDTTKLATIRRSGKADTVSMAFHLHSARFFTLERLRIVNDSLVSKGKGVHLDGNSAYINIRSCHFHYSHYAQHDYAVGNTENSMLNEIRIENNRITQATGNINGRPKVAIQIRKNSDRNSPYHRNIRISGNYIAPFLAEGIFVENTRNLTVDGNIQIEDRDDYRYTNDFYSLRVWNIRNMAIRNNRWQRSNRQVVDVRYCVGLSEPIDISNNEIVALSSVNNNPAALFINGSNMALRHNTLVVYGDYLASYALGGLADSNLYLVGNNFINYGKGMAAQVELNGLRENHGNNFFTNGPRVIHLTKKTNGYLTYNEETDSIPFSNYFRIDPYFYEKAAQIPANIQLQNKVRDSVLFNDILGNKRDSLSDIGCYEFKRPAADASILWMDASTFCEGNQNISVSIRNDGYDTLRSCALRLLVSRNDSAFTEVRRVHPQLKLSNGQRTSVDLGSISFSQNQLYKLRIEIDSANGVTDSGLVANRVETDSFRTSLSGEYSVGKPGDDFPDLYQAIDQLNRWGVCGPVRFLLRDTTFKRSIRLVSIPGVSSVNTIEFTSHPANRSLPRLDYPSKIAYLYNDIPYKMIMLENCSHITFDSMVIRSGDMDTLPNSNYYQTRLIELKGKTGAITFSNDSIIDIPVPDQPVSSQNYRYHFYLEYDNKSAGYERISILNCAFLGGADPVFVNSPANYFSPGKMEIRNSTFDGYVGSILVQSVDSMFFHGNKISNVRSVNGRHGFGFSSACAYCSAEGNEVHLRFKDPASTSVSRTGIAFGNTVSPYVPKSFARIVNNMVSITGDSSRGNARGISFRGYDAFIAHNSVNISSAGFYKSALSLSGDYYDTSEVELYNNSLVNKTTGPAIIFENTYLNLKSDHNNFLTKGPNLSTDKLVLKNLEAWQKRFNSDQNSLSIDPEYVNDTNLHTVSRRLNHGAMRLASVTTDIDGDHRDTTRLPDIGADEFNISLNDARIVGTDHLGRCPDSQYVYIDLINDGDDSIRSADVSWFVKRGTSAWQKMGSVRWNGGIDLLDTFRMQFGKIRLEADSLIKLRFEIDSVNGAVDTVHKQNLWTTDTFTTALPSVIEVSTGSGPYRNLGDVVDALHFRGVCGPTRIEFRAGEYVGNDSLGAFPGMGRNNPVTFTTSPKDTGYARLVTNWDSTGSDYLFQLNGAQFIRFDSMTFEGDGNTSQAVFKLLGNTQYIHFNRDTLISKVYKNYAQRGLIMSGFDAKDSSKFIYVTNNYFNGPNHGVHLWNYNSNTRVDSVLIRNNHFERLFNPINTAALEGLLVENNTINITDPPHSQAVGIWGNLCYGAIYRNNKVVMRGKDQLLGFWLEHRQDGTTDEKVFVENNFVSIDDQDRTAHSLGMLISYIRDVRIAHNSVWVSSSDTFSTAIASYLADRWPGKYEFYNNSMQGSGAARAFFLWTDTSSTWRSDNNNYFSQRSKSIRVANHLGNLSLLQQRTGQDSNSLQVHGDFFAWDDLHTNSPYLSRAGKRLDPPITTDIDGEMRDSMYPSIGADEYPYRARQAKVTGYFPPSYCPGISAFHADIRNIGEDSIYSLNIRYALRTAHSGNEVVKDTTHRVALAPGDSARLMLGTIRLSGDSAYTILIRVDSINHSDTFHKREHIRITDTIRTALSGVFTVGRSSSHYRTLTAAVDDLNKRGICGHIRYLIHEGTYNEQIDLDNIFGNSSDRSIEFVAHPSNKAPVRIVYAPKGNSDNFVVRIKDLTSITFDSLTLVNPSADYGRVIQLSGKNDHIHITNDSIISGYNGISQYLWTIEQEDIAWTGQYLNNFELRNCVIRGGSSQLYLGTTRTGNPKSRKFDIVNNQFVDFLYNGILFYQVDSLEFSHNLIESLDSGAQERYAMRYYQGKTASIHDNRIYLLARIPEGVLLGNDSGTSSKPLEFYNNQIVIRNWATGVQNRHTACLNIDRGNYIDVAHNNLKADAGKSWLHVIFIPNTYGPAPGNLKIRNNILSGFRLAECIYTPFGASDFYSDYNGFYGEHSTLATMGKKAHPNLASLQSIGTDANSVFGNPLYYGNYDLHTRSKAFDGKGTPLSAYPKDIDGEQRNSSKPDIGADEMNKSIHDLSLDDVLWTAFDICGSADQSVPVVINNKGTFDENSFRITLVSSGPVYDTIALTVRDTLEYGSLDTFFLKGLDLSAIGTYDIFVSVTVSKDSFQYNDTFRFTWKTRALVAPVLEDYEGCLNESYFVFLKGPKGFSDYKWYKTDSSTKILSRDSVYRVIGLKQTDSFYVEFSPPFNVPNGAKDYTIGTLEYSKNFKLGLRFDVQKYVVIDSVTVYPQSTGNLQINIKDSSSRIIYSRIFPITTRGKNELPLNVLLDKGRRYTIDLDGSDVLDINRNTNGAKYPYTDKNGLIRITSDESNALNAYNFFYDWKLKTPYCGKTGRHKVRAIIKSNPVNPVMIADSVCTGSTAYFISSNSGSNTVSWYRKEYDTQRFWTGDSLGIADLSSAYRVFVQFDSTNGCSSRRISSTVYPKPNPPQPALRDTFACSVDSVRIALASDTVYRWYQASDSKTPLYEGNVFDIDIRTYDSIWVSSLVRTCEGKRSLMLVDKKQLPKLPEIRGERVICEGTDLDLTTDSVVIQWYQDGKQITLDSVFHVTNPASGIYDFEIRKDSLGCINKGKLELTVRSIPKQYKAESDSVCPDSFATLRVNASSEVYWFKTDTSAVSLHHGKTFTDKSGKAVMYFIELDSLGCRSNRYPVQAYMDSSLIPGMEITGKRDACFGDEAFASAIGKNGAILWYEDARGVSFYSGGDTLRISATSESGRYFVRSENRFCKSAMDSVEVSVYPLPHAGFSSDQVDRQISLQADSVIERRRYSWKHPDGNSAGTTSGFSVNADGFYRVELDVYDSLTGCSNSMVDSVEVIGLYAGKLSKMYGIRLYPNPNRGNFIISHSGLSGGYQVYDAAGRMVLSGKLDQDGRTDVKSMLSAGVYQVVLRTEYGSFIDRIAVQ